MYMLEHPDITSALRTGYPRSYWDQHEPDLEDDYDYNDRPGRMRCFHANEEMDLYDPEEDEEPIEY